MKRASNKKLLSKLKLDIGREIRELRTERRWSQSDLAARLDLPQSRLSGIETGTRSLPSEHFLLLLQLFNVPASRFVPERADPEAELQNALARHGAAHLRENETVLPSERLEDVARLVRDALASASPRLVTALAPVLVRHADSINLKQLGVELSNAGLGRRLPWLIDNVVEAIRSELERPLPRAWAKRYRRAALVLDSYREFASTTARSGPEDILDREVRSKQSLEQTRLAASPFSKRWAIVTDLQPADFASALEGARPRD